MQLFDQRIQEMLKKTEQKRGRQASPEIDEMKTSFSLHQKMLLNATQYVQEHRLELDAAAEKAIIHSFSTCGDYVRGAYYPGLLSPIIVGNSTTGKKLAHAPDDGSPYYVFDISDIGQILRSRLYRNGSLITTEYMTELDGQSFGVTLTQDGQPHITVCESRDETLLRRFYEAKYIGRGSVDLLSYLEEDYEYDDLGLVRGIRRTSEMGIVIRTEEIVFLRTDGQATAYSIRSYPHREGVNPRVYPLKGK